MLDNAALRENIFEFATTEMKRRYNIRLFL